MVIGVTNIIIFRKDVPDPLLRGREGYKHFYFLSITQKISIFGRNMFPLKMFVVKFYTKKHLLHFLHTRLGCVTGNSRSHENVGVEVPPDELQVA